MLAYKRAQARYKPRLVGYPYPNETHRTSFSQIPKTPTFPIQGYTVDDVVLMDHFRFLIKIGPDNYKSMQLLYVYTVWSDGRSELINVSWFRHDGPYAWLEDAFIAWCSIPRAANNSYLEAAKILRRVMPEITEEPDDAPAPKRAKTAAAKPKTTTTPAAKKKMYDFGPGGANNPVPLDNDSEYDPNDEPEPNDSDESSDDSSSGPSDDDTVQSDSDDEPSDDHEHPPGPFGHKQAWCSGCCEYHAKDAFTPEELQVPADERECRKFGANDQYGNQTRVNRAAKLDAMRHRHNKRDRHHRTHRKYTHNRKQRGNNKRT